MLRKFCNLRFKLRSHLWYKYT